MKSLSLKTCMVVCLILVMSLAACGSKSKPGADVTTDAKATAAPAQVEATKAPATEPTKPAAPAAEPTKPAAPVTEPTEEETLSITDRAEGLDKLKSYRARWVSEWTGTKDGKQETVTWDWTGEYVKEPKAMHFIFASSEIDNPLGKGAMEMWQVGDAFYMVMTDSSTGESSCISFSSSDQDDFKEGFFNPSSLGSLDKARYVGMDSVNGIRARHYKYDEKAESFTGFAKVEGEVWVAVDGGYVVKDTMRWEGGLGFLGSLGDDEDDDGAGAGQGQWTWELRDVDQPITIEPPEVCISPASDLPIMADATEKGTLGDTIFYKTASKLADVVEFYQKEMAAAGWKADDDPTIMDTLAMLGFTKDGQTAQIMISSDQDDDVTQVMISIQK